jgi:hypothetical protein
MTAAIYCHKSTDRSGVSDEQRSVARQVQHARPSWQIIIVIATIASVACAPSGYRKATVVKMAHIFEPDNLSDNPECNALWGHTARYRIEMDNAREDWNQVILASASELIQRGCVARPSALTPTNRAPPVPIYVYATPPRRGLVNAAYKARAQAAADVAVQLRQQHARVVTVVELPDRALVSVEITWSRHRTGKPDPLPIDMRGVLHVSAFQTDLTGIAGADPWYPPQEAVARLVAAWVVDNRNRLSERIPMRPLPSR